MAPLSSFSGEVNKHKSYRKTDGKNFRVEILKVGTDGSEGVWIIPEDGVV